MSFTAHLSPDLLPVEAGATAPLNFEVANRSEVPTRFEIEIEGLDPEWTAIPVPAFTVGPGEVQKEKIFFKPPRASESLAGDYPFVLKVRSLESGEARTVQGILQIRPYHHLSMEINPKKITTRKEGYFEVTLMNLGNTEHTVQLFGNDPEDACAFEFEHEQVTLGPGQQKAVETEVAPTSRSLVSSSRLYGITVSGRSIGTPSVMATAQAQLEQRPMLNPGALIFFALVALSFGLWLYFLPKPPSIRLEVDRQEVMLGEPIRIAWQALESTSAKITVNDKALAGGDRTSGELEYVPTSAGTLQIEAVAYRDSVESSPKSYRIHVIAPTPAPDPVIEQFSATPTQLARGETLTLKYKLSNSVERAYLEPSGQELNKSVRQIEIEADFTGTKEFALVALNKDGKSVRKSVTIKSVEKSEASIVVFDVAPRETPPGGGVVTVSWQLANAVRAELRTGASSRVLPDVRGSIDLSVDKDTVFRLVGYDEKGLIVEREIKIVVPPFPETIDDPVTITDEDIRKTEGGR